MRSEMLADLAEVERDLGTALAPQIFVWHGKNIPCAPSSTRKGTVIDLGGQLVNIALSLTVRWNEFTAADSEFITVETEEITADNETPWPQEGDLCEFEGVQYKVLAVTQCPFKSHISFDLGDPDR